MPLHGSESEDGDSCVDPDGGGYLPCSASGLGSERLTVVVEHTSFTEEKMVLVRGCEYFQALYRSGMRECRQQEIHLRGLPARGFCLVLEVLRGEVPVLDGDIIVEAIQCAAFLQVSPLTKYLIDRIDSDNCLLMFHTAATFGLWDLYHAAALFVRNMYADLEVEDNKLYIVGGVCGVQKQVVDSCFCYSVENNSWSKMAGPSQPRFNLSLVGLDSRLYAIGGECERTVMSSVETYHLDSGRWTFAAHLPRPAAGAACTKAMGRLFVCLWRPMETTEIYEYVLGKDQWRLVTSLIRHQSYGHCLVGHRDDLYVMRNGPSDDFLRCRMDCYNLGTGQWTSLPGHYANSKGSLFTAVVRGDSVFTLNRTMTLEYTVDGRTWKPRRQMKGFPRSGSVWTFLLQLPECIKDRDR
ncbi:unnamed protein product [Lampetra planeri]